MIYKHPNDKEELYDYVDKQYIGIYRRLTETLSNTLRKLAFAEGAICWLLINSSNIFSTQIKFILTTLIIFFIFDGLQYFLLSNEYKKLSEKYNADIQNGVKQHIEELVSSPETDKIGHLFFYIEDNYFRSIHGSFIFCDVLPTPKSYLTSKNSIFIALTANK